MFHEWGILKTKSRAEATNLHHFFSWLQIRTQKYTLQGQMASYEESGFFKKSTFFSIFFPFGGLYFPFGGPKGPARSARPMESRYPLHEFQKAKAFCGRRISNRNKTDIAIYYIHVHRLGAQGRKNHPVGCTDYRINKKIQDDIRKIFKNIRTNHEYLKK